jgi:hypothetical protein
MKKPKAKAVAKKDRVRELFELAKEFNVNHFTGEGVSFKMDLGADQPRVVFSDPNSKPNIQGEITEDELLYASSPAGAPNFKDGVPVFTTRLPFGGVAAAAAAKAEEAA